MGDDSGLVVNRWRRYGKDRLYVEHPEFRSRYDAQHPDLAAYLRDAIDVYARNRLT